MNTNNNENIMKNAAKQLGTTPEELQKAIDKSGFKNTINNLSPSQTAQINKALSDEEYMKKILSSPQAQAMINKLLKK